MKNIVNLGNKEKSTNKGITLIALVITIIVLLILAAVSIATLTGDNGILTKAKDAKNLTTAAEEIEQISLAYNTVIAEKMQKGDKIAVTAEELQTELTRQNADTDSTAKEGETNKIEVVFNKSKNKYVIDVENGKITEEGSGGTVTPPAEATLPKDPTGDTEPYLPTVNSRVDETYNTLENGLVVIDENENEWVWIEVPKSIYKNTEYNEGTAPADENDTTKIEKVMQNYAKDYRSSYTDTWYDGCGLSQSEYPTHKNNMLKSVYKNGGFYIARYEAGIGDGSIRTSHTNITTSSPKAVSKQGQIPYNWVTCSEAQILATGMGEGTGKTSSLMYGIQWDLVLKHIENRGKKTQNELKSNSSTWGNYEDIEFEVTRGKYSEDNGQTYTDVSKEGYPKIKNAKVLLTTGATEKNSVLEIYDLAGNEWEWTLEYTTRPDASCCYRGGDYSNSGSSNPAAYRNYSNKGYSNNYRAFRSALW